MTSTRQLGRFGFPIPGAQAPAVAVTTRWPFEWMYFSATMVAWSFTPLLRRLVDFHNGFFNPVSVYSLLPFLLVMPLALFCLRKGRLLRIGALFKRFSFIWIGTFGYGFVIAAALDNLGAATFSLAQYLVPMIAGIWLAGQDISPALAFRRLCVILFPCALLVALYGVFQWVDPPPWDVMWIDGSGFNSAFNPVPFGMRVFSTLNSPQPAADFCALTMVLLFPLVRFKNVWTWPLIGALGSALLLTLVREAWVGLIVGIVAYLVLSPRRLLALPAIGLFAVLLSVLVSTLPVVLGSGPNSDVISSRITTLTDVSHDESALFRQQEIRDALEAGLANPIGTGLGNIGTSARLGSASGSLGTDLDSGYLSRLLELGWLGTLAYLGVVIVGPLMLAARIVTAPAENPADVQAKVIGAASIAVCAVLVWADAANDSHYGLDGMFFWIALAMASLAAGSLQRNVPRKTARGVSTR